jgi:hypothetical protein
MKRREFITLLGGAAAAWPFAASAQQRDPMRRIGVLMAATADDPEYQARMGAFQQELALFGWSDGRNARVDTRWATINPDDIRRHAAELGALAPDVILAATGTTTVAPCYRRPAPCRSCSCLLLTRSVPVSLRAWRGRAATPLASSCSNTALGQPQR